MGRHRHAVNVRADGLATVLGPLLRDPRVRAATLVDVDSGMVLDACAGEGAAGDGAGGDLEMLGAGHAELVRVVLALLAGPECEVVVGAGGSRHHVARVVPDPHGDRLALSVVVDGPRRAVERARKRLRQVSAAAITAGPTTTRRPVPGGWPLPPPQQPRALPSTAGMPPPGMPPPGMPLPAMSLPVAPERWAPTVVASPGPREPLPVRVPAARRPEPSPAPGGAGVQNDPAISLFTPASAARRMRGEQAAAPVFGAALPDRPPPVPARAPGGAAPRPPAPPSALPPARAAEATGATGAAVPRPVDGAAGGAARNHVEPRH